MEAAAFINKWRGATVSEESAFSGWLTDLCALIGVPPPDGKGTADYTLEYGVNKPLGTKGFIDCYKRGAFVMEAKNTIHDPRGRDPGTGAARPQALELSFQRAFVQARDYAGQVPKPHGRPPFLILVELGSAIELYGSFNDSAYSYTPFPDAVRRRIPLDDLRNPDVRERLRLVWTNPRSLDPRIRRERTTVDAVSHITVLRDRLEADGADKYEIARFVLKLVFTAFAESKGLLPAETLARLLDRCEAEPGENAARRVSAFWYDLDHGFDRWNDWTQGVVPHFNGGVYAEEWGEPVEPGGPPVKREPKTLSTASVTAMRQVSALNWGDIEPAIFGTLYEQALNTLVGATAVAGPDGRVTAAAAPDYRKKFGAHYTPRPYIERLVNPTVIEPLYNDWRPVQAALTAADTPEKRAAAVDAGRAFLRGLHALRVLDPACGSGNFLYVAQDLLLDLEFEVLRAVNAQIGAFDALEASAVHPRQFLGLDANRPVVRQAEMVVWIGWLQWHVEHGGIDVVKSRRPMLDPGESIAHQNALLLKFRADDNKHAVDPEGLETDAAAVYAVAPWPEADFIVGNPPFAGAGEALRNAVGDAFAEALGTWYPEVPRSCDLVMYWWYKAARLLGTPGGRLRRFGFITTNSVGQTRNRKVLDRALEAKAGERAEGATRPVSLVYAVPDHPWHDGKQAAAVRIAMTVAVRGEKVPGLLARVTGERLMVGTPNNPVPEGVYEVDLRTQVCVITADLKPADLSTDDARSLYANALLASPGVKLHGAGFIVTRDQVPALLGFAGPDAGAQAEAALKQSTIIREYRNGRDLTQRPRGVYVIDAHGLTQHELRARYPAIYGRLHTHVRPERESNRMPYRRDHWWLFGATNRDMRAFLAGLPRYIATTETAKHRVFQFLDASVLPDNMIVAVGLADGFSLAVLSSRVHTAWALAAGGRLGVGNDPRYNKTRCFDCFPFPDEVPEALRAQAGRYAEQLDAMRKERLATLPRLTLTDMYNAIEAVRTGRPLTAAEAALRTPAYIDALASFHDDIDRLVLRAYGWPEALAAPGAENDAEIVRRVLALNRERAREEQEGVPGPDGVAQKRIRWLRPAFQMGRVRTNGPRDLFAPAAAPADGDGDGDDA